MKIAAYLILILFLPVLVIATGPQTCIVQTGNSFTCYSSSAVIPQQGTFAEWCDNQGGTVQDGVASTFSQCILVCCCDGTVAVDENTLSRSACVELGGNTFLDTPPAGYTCTDVCGGATGGTTSTTYEVRGTVLDQDGNPLAEASVNYPSDTGSNLITVITDQDGSFSFPAVSTGQKNFLADADGCEPETQVRDVEGALVLDFNLMCMGSCSVSPGANVTASAVQGERKVAIGWQSDSCAAEYQVMRCLGSASGCIFNKETIGYVPASTTFFFDTTPPPGQGLCYSVKPLNSSFEAAGDGSFACIPGMDAYCVENHQSSMVRCFNNEVVNTPLGMVNGVPQRIAPFTGLASCQNDNRLHADKECSQDEVCTYGDNGPYCTSGNSCDACNGPFGLFAALLGDSCASSNGCIANNQQYIVDSYQNCAAISSCADYRTQAACDRAHSSGADWCLTTLSGCTWKQWPGLQQLGTGACVPKGDAQVCDACSTLYGDACNATLCESLGDTCYFDGSDCLASTDDGMGCVGYTDQTDCIGSQQASVDANYSETTHSERVAGTNLLTPSDDKFGYGTCFWHAETGRCLKDADGYKPDSLTGTPLDDCIQDGSYNDDVWIAACRQDNTPPVTTLPFDSDEYIDAGQLRYTQPVVTDNHYWPSQITTQFCIVPKGGAPCYPDEQPLSSLIPSVMGSQSYTLYYYSEDPSHNLEPVKNITLIVYTDGGAELISASLIPTTS